VPRLDISVVACNVEVLNVPLVVVAGAALAAAAAFPAVAAAAGMLPAVRKGPLHLL